VLLAERLHYLDNNATMRLMQMSCEVGRLLNGLIRSLSQDP
jgi:hypothetical protein